MKSDVIRLLKAVKQKSFTALEKAIRPCNELAEALGFREGTRMSIDSITPANQPSELIMPKPATVQHKKRKANARDATSPPPIPVPSKKPRKEQNRKRKPGTLVMEAVVIETRARKHNLDLTRFIDKYELERRRYSTALLRLEDNLREIGL